MKPTNFLVVLCTTFTAFVITSCGGNADKTESNTADSTSANTVVTAQSNIDTSTQYMMNVRHKVANYAKWKPIYDAHDSARLANGVHNYVVARGTQDSNMIMLAFKVDDVARAKAFAKDPGLKQAMQKGGVTGAPMISYHEMVYQDTTTLPSNTTRTMITYTVKDWDAWRKGFGSHRQVRSDNGITDRVYGHDVDDNHKVVLVVAINDSAKANAFWKSEQVKQFRAEAGVVSQPEMFSYRVVQRY